MSVAGDVESGSTASTSVTSAIARSSGSTPALSVVVVSWNTRALLGACLTSLLGQAERGDSVEESPTRRFDVVVVDNASTDGTPEMVRELFPWVRLVENRENVGFARANNQAIRACDGEYVLLLNPDTEVRPGALAALTGFMESHPRAGGAGARLLNPDGTPQVSCWPAPLLGRELWRMLHLDAIHPYARYPESRWGSSEPVAVDVAQGACLILRRRALDEVGLLDEDYFIYSEEVDLCDRLRARGWQIWWVPQAEVVHYGGQSTGQVAPSMFVHLYGSKVLYFRKRRGKLSARIYQGILLITALARLLLTPLAYLEPAPRRQRHLALAGDYARLLRSLTCL